ncbi:hypothetical protein TB2_028903 [Malus domestica]
MEDARAVKWKCDQMLRTQRYLLPANLHILHLHFVQNSEEKRHTPYDKTVSYGEHHRSIQKSLKVTCISILNAFILIVPIGIVKKLKGKASDDKGQHLRSLT